MSALSSLDVGAISGYGELAVFITSNRGVIQVGNKLYVGNLSYGIKSSDLEQMFAAHGAVMSAEVVSDRETQRSKGFGFVEMGSESEALAAIEALNGKSVEGRALTVNEARPQAPRSQGGLGGAQRRTGVRGPYGTGRAGTGGGNRH